MTFTMTIKRAHEMVEIATHVRRSSSPNTDIHLRELKCEIMTMSAQSQHSRSHVFWFSLWLTSQFHLRSCSASRDGRPGRLSLGRFYSEF